jgi:hypothetical protein
MRYPLRPETIELISAAQTTPDFSLLDMARIEFEAADIVARSLPTEANRTKATDLYENYLLMIAIVEGYEIGGAS